MNFSDKTYIMGILNVTTDSFFDGNKYFEKNKAIEHALKMVEDGADIIDIGGESTKPNSFKISAYDEINRIIDIILEIRKYKNVLISVDTYKSEVAKEALKVGANIVNDVYGALYDKKIFNVVRDYGAYICITHNRLNSKNSFINIVDTVYSELNERYMEALGCGIDNNNIILDPGIGFSKYGVNNILILRDIDKFKQFDCPILLGISRKKFLKYLDNLDPLKNISSTIYTNAYLISKGINILRVHDVKENKEMVDIINSIIFGGNNIG